MNIFIRSFRDLRKMAIDLAGVATTRLKPLTEIHCVLLLGPEGSEIIFKEGQNLIM